MPSSTCGSTSSASTIFKALLETQPERVKLQETVKYNPMIQTMQERLLTLEMDKQRLLTLYTDNDRRVQDKQQEIDAQKKRLTEAQDSSGFPTPRSRSSTTGAGTWKKRCWPPASRR